MSPVDPVDPIHAARQRLEPPAIVLMGLGGLGVLGSLLSLALWVAGVGAGAGAAMVPGAEAPELRQLMELVEGGAFTVIANLFQLAASAVVVVGAWQMRQLSTYPLAVIASIVAAFPCTSPCCCLIGTPVGIWALILLLDERVRVAFR